MWRWNDPAILWLLIASGLLVYWIASAIWHRIQVRERAKLERWQRRALIEGEPRGFPVEAMRQTTTTNGDSMKRFRVLFFDYDTRAHFLAEDIPEHWEDRVKESHRQSRTHIEKQLVHEYGEMSAQEKQKNFIDVGVKPISVLAYHNVFLQQVRTAFVMSAYYPAATAACALGERILNHLTIALRDDFKARPEYKRVYKKDSFDNWDLAIDTLEAWEVLLPSVATEFRLLRDHRNRIIHFRPEADRDDREMALAAISSLTQIISGQFGAMSAPWLFNSGLGEFYVKKEWAKKPFIAKIYLPNCVALGPHHKVLTVLPWTFKDDATYEDREVSDEEFAELRRAAMQ